MYHLPLSTALGVGPLLLCCSSAGKRTGEGFMKRKESPPSSSLISFFPVSLWLSREMKLNERGGSRREKGGKRAGKRQRSEKMRRRDRKVGRQRGRKRGGNRGGRERRRKGFCRGLFQQPPATAAQKLLQQDYFSVILLPSIPSSKQPLRNTEFKRQRCTEPSDFLPRIQCLQEAQIR